MFTRLTAIGSDRMLALSFSRMADDKKQRIYVVPPLLRKEVLQQTVSEGHYIHGYMQCCPKRFIGTMNMRLL